MRERERETKREREREREKKEKKDIVITGTFEAPKANKIQMYNPHERRRIQGCKKINLRSTSKMENIPMEK